MIKNELMEAELHMQYLLHEFDSLKKEIKLCHYRIKDLRESFDYDDNQAVS